MNLNKYNPEKHHRRSIRLKGYDYSQAGAYFITICCAERLHRFGKVENQEMLMNVFGEIAQNEWEKLPERFQNIELGAFVVMPDHLHFIICLNEKQNHTIGDVVGAYKSLVLKYVANWATKNKLLLGDFWQRNYYEHIIRNENSYQKITDYIFANPANWTIEKQEIAYENYENFVEWIINKM